MPPLGTEPARQVGGLPAVHALVSVQHLPPQLLGLDPAGELEVGELLPQQLRPQERLRDEAAAQPQGRESGIRAAAPALPHGISPGTAARDPPACRDLGYSKAASNHPSVLHPERRQELGTAMPTPSKKVKLLHGEFWEIRISKRDQNPANSRRSWNLPRRSQSRKPPGTPGSAKGTALARGKEPMGLFRNCVPAAAVTRDEKQHRAPSRGSTSSPRASWSTACRGPGTGTALENADGGRKS